MRAASFPLAIQVDVPSSHWDGLLAADLVAPEGTPWLAVFDGVARPIDVPDGGHALLLTAADGTVAYYAHGRPERASGPVRAGDVVGYVSDSGNARGNPHLHFAVGSWIDDQGAGNVDPRAWLSGAAAGQDERSGMGRREWGNLAAAVLLAVGALALLALLE